MPNQVVSNTSQNTEHNTKQLAGVPLRFAAPLLRFFLRRLAAASGGLRSEAVRAVGYATLDVAAQCRAAAKPGPKPGAEA